MFRACVSIAMSSWLLAAGCSKAREDAAADARQPSATAAPAPSGESADNPQCKLFTVDEIGQFIGETVSPGQNAALGTGCQWLASDGSGDVIVAVVPASYHEPPTKSDGYKPLTDVGAKGFVAPQLDGWVAGAVVGEDAIRVSVAGNSASDATAVALLKETIKRRAPQSGHRKTTRPAHT